MDANAHFNVGNNLQELGRVNIAKASFWRAIKLKYHYAYALFNLGITLCASNKLQEAEQSLRQVKTLWPNYDKSFSI